MSYECPAPSKRRGVLIGGSGLIGGSLQHYFKTLGENGLEVLSPNSKKLSLREPRDITRYFERYKPDFIINAAIAAIDSDPQLAYEINYLGVVRLAEIAIRLGIPLIHFSSAAVMPTGENLTEEDRLPLHAGMSNYAKSKLMAELTLEHLHRKRGLDFTAIRLAVVYGKHDHKIQGFHRLLFSVADQAMPMLLTRPGVRHSYSFTRKIPPFVSHLLEHREEFSGQTYNFVDREPVDLASLILTIRNYLSVDTPRKIYIPYPLARLGKTCIRWVVRKLAGIGIDARMPAELLFLENFYQSQTLDPGKLERSSYRDPYADITVISQLPDMIQYYLERWEHLNLISLNEGFLDPREKAEEFLRSPATLLETVNRYGPPEEDEPRVHN